MPLCVWYSRCTWSRCLVAYSLPWSVPSRPISVTITYDWAVQTSFEVTVLSYSVWTRVYGRRCVPWMKEHLILKWHKYLKFWNNNFEIWWSYVSIPLDSDPQLQHIPHKRDDLIKIVAFLVLKLGNNYSAELTLLSVLYSLAIWRFISLVYLLTLV